MSTDPNAEAARVVREANDKGNPLQPDFEAAWEAWINRIRGIDERARALLRAASRPCQRLFNPVLARDSSCR